MAPANRIRYLRRDRDVQVLEEAPSHAALINMSDHIWLIETVSAEVVPHGMVAQVRFRTLHGYKGQGVHDAISLILPADVEANKRYLVFLVEWECGFITLATRRGSLVAEDDPQFSALVQRLTAARP